MPQTVSKVRRAPRKPLRLLANKYVAGAPQIVELMDVSSTGVLLKEIAEPEQLAQQIGLQFQIPGTAHVVYAEGEIVRDWSRAAAKGQGVRFTLLPGAHRSALMQFLSQRTQVRKAA